MSGSSLYERSGYKLAGEPGGLPRSGATGDLALAARKTLFPVGTDAKLQ